MSKPVWGYKGVVLLVLISASLFLLSGFAEAKNPDLSYWTLNLSESAAPTELGEEDFNQEIEVVGNTMHAMWLTQNADWSGYKVYYRRSTDNGQTWEAKQLLFTGDRLDYAYTYKRMVAEGNYVHIAVSQSNIGGSLYYLRSTDNGASFEAPKVLFTSDAEHAYFLFNTFVAVSAGKVTIAFQHQCNYQVNNACLILNTDNHGANFIQHEVYSTDTGNSWRVRDLQRVGDRIYVLYTDESYYYGIVYGRLYLAASANAGGNFISTKISVPSSDGQDKTYALQDNHYVPKIAGVGNTVSVIWSGLDGDDVDSIFYRRSTDSGANFGAVQNLSRDVIPADKALQAGQETLAAQGSYVYSVFVSTASNVYLRRSIDSGASFLGLQELSYTTGHYAGGRSLDGGWWPVIKTDPTVSSGAKVHVLWDWPIYCYSADGGASFTKPELVTPYFSYGGSLTSGANRPYMTIGPNGKVHLVVEARYFANSFGGYGDFDIFYRGFSPAPAPSGSNNALKLVSSHDDARWDNMQVPASSYLNFTSQMTGEVWVRPYPGGETTGTTSYTTPIFHKAELNYLSYALQTWNRYGQRQAQAQIRTADGDFWVNPADSTEGLVPDNVWSHLAFTYNAAGGANNFKLYLNGQLIATATATGNLATVDGLFFTGIFGIWDVAELRLWNVVRTQTQIAANMYRSLVGNEAGLNAYYTFKNTTKDITGHGNDGLLMYMEQYLRKNISLPALNFLLLMNN